MIKIKTYKFILILLCTVILSGCSLQDITIEKIDSVRYLSNFSTGKMGYALAKIAMLRGAEVTLISGKTNIIPPKFVKVINVLSAKEMFEAVKNNFEEQDIIIKAAAVADYRSKEIFDGKIKKKNDKLELLLERTDDILKYVGEHKTNQFVCGFSMETDNMIENSIDLIRKLSEKQS